MKVLLSMSKEDLSDKGACDEGRDWFRARFGDSCTVEWTPELQFELMQKNPGWLSWALWENLLPGWEATEFNISKAEMHAQEFYQSRLRLGRVLHSSLPYSYIVRSSMDSVTFLSCDISKSHIKKSSMTGCEFTDCNLENLSVCMSDLKSSSFCYSRMLSPLVEMSDMGFTSFLNCDISGGVFRKSEMFRSVFSSCSIGDISQCNLTDSVFYECTIGSISESNLLRSRFRNCKISEIKSCNETMVGFLGNCRVGEQEVTQNEA